MPSLRTPSRNPGRDSGLQVTAALTYSQTIKLSPRRSASQLAALSAQASGLDRRRRLTNSKSRLQSGRRRAGKTNGASEGADSRMHSRPTRRADSLSARVDPLADGMDGFLLGSDGGTSAFPRPSAAVHPNLLRNVVSAPLEMRYSASLRYSSSVADSLQRGTFVFLTGVAASGSGWTEPSESGNLRALTLSQAIARGVG